MLASLGFIEEGEGPMDSLRQSLPDCLLSAGDDLEENRGLETGWGLIQSQSEGVLTIIMGSVVENKAEI